MKANILRKLNPVQLHSVSWQNYNIHNSLPSSFLLSSQLSTSGISQLLPLQFCMFLPPRCKILKNLFSFPLGPDCSQICPHNNHCWGEAKGSCQICKKEYHCLESEGKNANSLMPTRKWLDKVYFKNPGSYS